MWRRLKKLKIMKNWKGTTEEVKRYGNGVNDFGGSYERVGTDKDNERLIGEYGC